MSELGGLKYTRFSATHFIDVALDAIKQDCVNHIIYNHGTENMGEIKVHLLSHSMNIEINYDGYSVKCSRSVPYHDIAHAIVSLHTYEGEKDIDMFRHLLKGALGHDLYRRHILPKGLNL